MNEEIAGRKDFMTKSLLEETERSKEKELKAFLIKIKTEDISNKILRFKQSQQIDITDELLKKYATKKNKAILREVSNLDVIKENISVYIFQIKNIVSNEKDILKKNKNSQSQLDIENLDKEYNKIIEQINIAFSEIEMIIIACKKILNPLLISINTQTGIDGNLKFCYNSYIYSTDYQTHPNTYYSKVNAKFIKEKEEYEGCTAKNNIYKYKNSDGNVLYSNEGGKNTKRCLNKKSKLCMLFRL